MDILQQQLKSFFIAVLWLFWFLGINKLFKRKSSLLLIHFLLVDLIQITKLPCNMLNLHNFYVCRNTRIKRNLDLWFSSFSLSFLQTWRDANIPYTEVYTPLVESCVAPLFWLLRQDFLSRETRVSSPAHRAEISQLLATSDPPGLGGNRSGSYGQIPLTQIPRLTNSFGANSSNTNTNTCLQAPLKAWLCFCTEQNISAGNSDCWHQNLVGTAGFGAQV